MNIVFGGSFNPVTKAHKTIISDLINLYKPSNFIVVPVGNVYDKKDLLDYKIRKEMLEISLFNLNIVISDLENESNHFLGTYDLLTKLNDRYKDIYFVLGADNLVNIKNWLNAKKLLDEYKFIIINRNNFNIEEYIKSYLNDFKDNFLIYNVTLNISSSIIRNNIYKYKEYLDDNVFEYIVKNKLYQKES